MDSYDEAQSRLDLITSEAGWYVYCIEFEEWHLYNDDDELLFSAPTIEELANRRSPSIVIDETRATHKIPKLATEPPTNTENADVRNYIFLPAHATEEERQLFQSTSTAIHSSRGFGPGVADPSRRSHTSRPWGWENSPRPSRSIYSNTAAFSVIRRLRFGNRQRILFPQTPLHEYIRSRKLSRRPVYFKRYSYLVHINSRGVKRT
jgi:hypothetical protein